MKQIGLLLVGGLALLVVVLLGAFNIFTSRQPAKSVIMVPVNPTITYLETTLAEQEQSYRAQAAKLEETLKQQQADLPGQLEVLNNQITTAQQELDDLIDQQQSLQTQLDQLKAAQTEQPTTGQSELEQVRRQYAARQAELQAAQSRLTEVNTQLGRQAGE